MQFSNSDIQYSFTHDSLPPLPFALRLLPFRCAWPIAVITASSRAVALADTTVVALRCLRRRLSADPGARTSRATATLAQQTSPTARCAPTMHTCTCVTYLLPIVEIFANVDIFIRWLHLSLFIYAFTLLVVYASHLDLTVKAIDGIITHTC